MLWIAVVFCVFICGRLVGLIERLLSFIVMRKGTVSQAVNLLFFQ